MRNHSTAYSRRDALAKSLGYRSYAHRRAALAQGSGLKGTDKNALRDHSSIYDRRNERARALGYESYAQRRRALESGEGLMPGDTGQD